MAFANKRKTFENKVRRETQQSSYNQVQLLHADMVTDTKHERNADIVSFKTNINFSLKNTYNVNF